MAAAAGGGSIAFLSCPSSSSFSKKAIPNTSSLSLGFVNQVMNQRRNVSCLALQETSTFTVAPETKEEKDEKTTAKTDTEPAEDGSAAPRAKPAAKAPVKTLPQLMEEDVIPSLKATLESLQDISELELSFSENKLEGSFLKKGQPYTFWAFFPDGTINGPKGFSLSSYGSGVSTVEPFLVDEKKPTPKLVVFWVEKRLAAQGIIPVWRD